MSDIYTILAKHFAGESNPQEEQLVKKFKDENLDEYNALRSMWSNKEIKLSKFDTSRALDSIQGKLGKPKKKNLFSSFVKIAALVAFLILVLGGMYYLSIQEPEQIEIFAENQNRKVELEDGTIVHLNKNSNISYPAKFANNSRNVILNGEAFFEVAKEAGRPFLITTTQSLVEVLGTSFNVNANEKSTTVSVTTGKVKVESINTKKSTVLLPNQSALVFANRLEEFGTKNKNYQAWRTGEFKFENSPISEVVQELNEHFDNQIKLSNKDAECLLSTSFKQLELSEILEIIALSCNLKSTQKNEIYELY